MIQLIYSQLTGRVVQPPTVGVDPTARQGADPSFMGPNASTLLGQKIKESEMSTTLIDQKAAQSRAKAILDEHESNLNANRPEQPSRMASMMSYRSWITKKCVHRSASVSNNSDCIIIIIVWIYT